MPARTMPLTEFLPATAPEYYRRWLGHNRHLKHGDAAVGAFVREHPSMFGGQTGVVAGGYSIWVVRSGGKDDPETFGGYIADRYERWRAARIEARQNIIELNRRRSSS